MSGESNGLETEINHLVEVAEDSNSKYAKDPYFIGLLTSILFNVGRDQEAIKYGKKL